MGALGKDSTRVAEYILWLAGQSNNPVTPMQLLKLVYICHGWMVGLYSRPLIKDQIEAWQYGPVIPGVYRQYKAYGGSYISESPEKPTGFDSAEESIMQQVWKHYGKMSGLQLSSLTHQKRTPWDITWSMRGPGCVISNDLIEQHYKQLAAAK
ncbi:MAG: DUF4065 domain-containing protein [Bryobacteraceae bacterium]